MHELKSLNHLFQQEMLVLCNQIKLTRLKLNYTGILIKLKTMEHVKMTYAFPSRGAKKCRCFSFFIFAATPVMLNI